MSDDVPFSCCSTKAERPCIHHHVHQNDRHLNYDYNLQVTLNTMGCKEALMEFFGDTILTNAGSGILGIFGLQV